MAEDPGVSTLAALIESLRQSFNLVHDSASKITSGIVDIVRTRMYLKYRRGDTQKGIRHGYQSLKKLRLQEGQGVSIISAEVGKWDDVKPLKAALKEARIDFALSADKDGVYTLYYKNVNEADVLKAQNKVLQERFGEPLPQETIAPSETLNLDLNQEINQSNEQSPDVSDIEKEETQRKQEREEQEVSTLTVPTERTASQDHKTHDVTSTVRDETVQGKNYEPLESLIKEAKERARKKNLDRGNDRDRAQTRTKSRTKTREYDMGH